MGFLKYFLHLEFAEMIQFDDILQMVPNRQLATCLPLVKFHMFPIMLKLYIFQKGWPNHHLVLFKGDSFKRKKQSLNVYKMGPEPIVINADD